MTLQTGFEIAFIKTSFNWEAQVDGITYMAPTKEQIIEMVRGVYPTVDLNLTETKHRNYVFHPHKYPIQ